MTIRQALRRQSLLASSPRGKEPRAWCASNIILAMMLGCSAVAIAIEILRG
ncbi:hypothetical protein [Oryzifoliimicrobium ureilyticus]|uniref:hypothetical protein n=1 Tax=Oryzifoliimicrobium ureilyticus TaxID=3113724 RepID=UPI0030763D5B